MITVEEIFLDFGKQMLETSYNLNLGQLFKIAPKLKKYLWQKLKSEKIGKNTIKDVLLNGSSRVNIIIE
jgi:hypothetical protein